MWARQLTQSYPCCINFQSTRGRREFSTCTSAHRQLCRPKQNQIHDVFDVVSPYWFARGSENLFPTTRAHKICAQLVFGLLKLRFRLTKIKDLYDTANCVSLSASVNVPQLVGSLDGTTFVFTNN